MVDEDRRINVGGGEIVAGLDVATAVHIGAPCRRDWGTPVMVRIGGGVLEEAHHENFGTHIVRMRGRMQALAVPPANAVR